MRVPLRGNLRPKSSAPNPKTAEQKNDINGTVRFYGVTTKRLDSSTLNFCRSAAIASSKRFRSSNFKPVVLNPNLAHPAFGFGSRSRAHYTCGLCTLDALALIGM